ncbi:TetR/AcrR family transcriptional regulator [Pseudomonas sp. Au-Pse12]|uniref:TetR/AcrR family transcriptional regulator n=1 Tax=Pseudomonas sp. Au-Pse12 TaxID=2906459 RepID=UPI001E4D2EEA|nr:TetR/AcrR family transcriptional regulator [Pseudomonas sp. Au-Pse12]MCE4056835.1 TetR/AcrR family transcriptional regulator [Pseudomonas sp. Au-Pse12]
MTDPISKPRGRPRAYDPELALERALQAFWKGGFSGTSLDDLATATGMNRPSLYAGLGDKRTIYIKAMQRFRDHAQRHFGRALEAHAGDNSFADVIERYLKAAIELEAEHPDTGISGCAVVSTATAEALVDPQIRQLLDDVLHDMDEQLLTRLQDAVEAGELPANTEVGVLGFLLTSTAHSIGIRARAGQERQAVEELAGPIAQMLFHATRNS